MNDVSHIDKKKKKAIASHSKNYTAGLETERGANINKQFNEKYLWCEFTKVLISYFIFLGHSTVRVRVQQRTLFSNSSSNHRKVKN